MSQEERPVESLLLKVRWQQIENGIERQLIKIRNNKIYIQNELHGQVINSVFVSSGSQQDKHEMDTTHNNWLVPHSLPNTHHNDLSTDFKITPLHNYTVVS